MKSKILYYSIVIDLFLFIVGGNVISATFAGTRVRLSEIFSIVLGFVLLTQLKLEKDKSLLMILLWSALSLLLIGVHLPIYGFGLKDGVKAVLYLVRFVFAVFSAYLFAKYAKSIGKKDDILNLVNLFYLAACLIGFFQYLVYPVANEWYALFAKFGVIWNGDPHVSRLISTDFDPNFFSSCLLIGVSVNAYLLRKKFTENKRLLDKAKLPNLAYFLIYLAAIILTKSRSGLVGLIVIALLTYCSYLNVKKLTSNYFIFGIIAVNVLTALLAFSNISAFARIRNVLFDPSAGARFSSWAKSLEIIKDTYFLGMGYNLFPSYNSVILGVAQSNASGGVDSSLLFILITTGIVGLGVLIAHYVFLLKNKNKEFVFLFIAALVISNFNNLLFYSMWVLPFYFCTFLCEREKDGKTLSETPTVKSDSDGYSESGTGVSVILINYGTYELTKQTITTLIEHTRGLKYEIILIDNNSPDGSGALLNEEFCGKIKYIQAEENLGTSKAFNRALKLAEGKYVLWLNPDVIFTDNFIKTLYDFMEATPDCGVCGGNLTDKDCNPVHSFRKNMVSFKTLKKDNSLFVHAYRKLFRKFISEEYNYTGKPLEVGYITGADMLVRREIFDKLGGFDEDIFMYAEETEFQFRVKKSTGYKIYSVPSARLIHLEGKSFSGKEFSETRHRLTISGTAVFMQKSYGEAEMLKYLDLLKKSYKKFYTLFWFWKSKKDMYKVKYRTVENIKLNYIIKKTK